MTGEGQFSPIFLGSESLGLAPYWENQTLDLYLRQGARRVVTHDESNDFPTHFGTQRPGPIAFLHGRNPRGNAGAHEEGAWLLQVKEHGWLGSLGLPLLEHDKEVLSIPQPVRPKFGLLECGATELRQACVQQGFGGETPVDEVPN